MANIILPGGLPNPFPPLTGVQDGDSNTAGVTGENSVASGLQIGAGVQGTSSSFGVIGQLRGVGTGETAPVVSAGVWGRGGSSGDGVFGNSLNNAGVIGDSINFDGVLGRSHHAHHAGVSGHNTAGGLAGFFEGDVHITGKVTADVDFCLPHADCAEDFDIADSDSVESGTVMVLAEDGTLHPSQQAYDKRAAGVISGAGEYKPGIVLDRRKPRGGRKPVALLGKVYCKVDAGYSSIEVGDLLTTSPTPGHAMKADDPVKAFGAVIGKAMRPLPAGQALIPILVALQ